VSPRTYSNARDSILDAAERILLRERLLGLSIDAVVKEAAVSKGGFFYHFATKEALLSAVLERLVAQVGAQLEALAADDCEPTGRQLRAHVKLTLELERAERRRLQALVLALMAAALESPAVAAQARAANRQALAQAASEGVDLGRALVVQLALDGYWLGESVGTTRLEASQKAAFRDALLALLRPPSPARKGVKR
jgi:AcrR family transcriptional regulator